MAGVHSPHGTQLGLPPPQTLCELFVGPINAATPPLRAIAVLINGRYMLSPAAVNNEGTEFIEGRDVVSVGTHRMSLRDVGFGVGG